MNKVLNFNFPLWFALFIFSVVIMLISIFSDGFNKNFSYYFANIVVAVDEATNETFESVFYESIKNRSYIKSVKKENLELRKSIEILQNQILKYKQEKQVYNQFVKQKDKLAAFNIKDTMIASVIHSANFFNNKYVSINIGKNDGVIDNMAVVSEYGVVGQIISVNKSTSIVMLITDSRSRIPAFTENSNENGVIIGDGESDNLKFVPYNEYSQQIDGEIIFTSGFDGIFPRSVPIAKIVKNGDVVNAVPIVDINKVFYVNVIFQKDLGVLQMDENSINGKIDVPNKNKLKK